MHKVIMMSAFRCLVVIGLFTSIRSLASADWPYDQFCFNWDEAHGYYSQESIPFYALHPPVYYSYPISRTYGLIPFAYVPAIWPRQEAFENEKTVRNSFVEQAADEKTSIAKGPLLVVNPFMEQNEVSNQVKKASWETAIASRIKIIYPSKMASGG